MGVAECGTTPEHTVHIGNRLDTDVRPAKALGIGTIWVLRGEAPPSRHPSRWPRPTSPFRTSPRSPTSSSNAPRHDHTHARHRPRHRLRPLCRPRHGHGKRCRAGGFDLAQPERGPGAVSRQNPTYARVALDSSGRYASSWVRTPVGWPRCRSPAPRDSGAGRPERCGGRCRSRSTTTPRAPMSSAQSVSRASSLWADVGSPPGVSGLGGPRRPTSSTPPWPVVPCLPTPRTGSRPGSTSPLGIGRSTRWRRSDSTGPTRDSCPSSSSPAPASAPSTRRSPSTWALLRASPSSPG